MVNMEDGDWDIRLTGRSWSGAEFHQRADLRPEKLEIWEGRLLFDDQERVNLLGLLLENLGADRVVRMGKPEVWVDAVRFAHPKILVKRRPFLSDPFNRWMLGLWCMNLIVIAAVLVLPRNLPPMSPQVAWALLTAVIAAAVSFAVNAFLRL